MPDIYQAEIYSSLTGSRVLAFYAGGYHAAKTHADEQLSHSRCEIIGRIKRVPFSLRQEAKDAYMVAVHVRPLGADDIGTGVRFTMPHEGTGSAYDDVLAYLETQGLEAMHNPHIVRQ